MNMKSTISKSSVLDRCEDTIIDLLINTTPYPPTESTKIRMFIDYRLEKLTAPYRLDFTNEELKDRTDKLIQMYVGYCNLTEHVYGSYSA